MENMAAYILFCQETSMWQKRAKNAKKRNFIGLPKFFCYCNHILCARELIFLPHLKIYYIKLQSKGQLHSMLQTIFRTNQRLDVKKITKMARKNPSFDLEQNPLEAKCTIRFSKIPPSFVVRYFSQLA